MAFRTSDDRSAGRSRSRRDADFIPRRRGPSLEGVKEIDINNADFLRQFLTEHGKIIPSRMGAIPAKQQRLIKRGIRRCRTMGLLP